MLCDPAHLLDRYVLLSALHCAHVTAVESALVSKPLLGKPLLPAQLRNSFSKFFLGLLHSRHCPCMLSGQSTTYRETTYRRYTLRTEGKQEMSRAARRFQVCTLAFLLLSAKASLPVAAKGALQVPFEYATSRDSMLVRVLINNKPAVLIFDTGSAHTIVRPELIGVSPKELIPTEMAKSGGGFMGDAVGREVSLQVGSFTLKKRKVVVMDLSQILSVYEEKIDGILGLDFIKEFRQVTIDMKEKTITFAY